MSRFTLPVCASLPLALLLVFLAVLPAKADDLGKRITIDVAPVWLFATNGDGAAPPPPGFKGVGYTKDNPVPSTVRIDYGIDVAIDGKTDLRASHTNVAYQLGRILTAIPNTALVTGSIYDYTDSIGLYRSLGRNFVAHVTYFDHQRSEVTGLCLNQKKCLDAAGGVVSNPLSIDEHGYTLGGSLDFGPKTRIGPLLNAGFDIKYVPRPSTPSSPAVALGGLGAYKGSQVLYPYSMTLKIPILPSTTVIPFVNYTNLPVLYRDSAVPEAYRGILWGVTKVISKNVTFSYTNFNLQTCRCIARVPPPDNLRLAFGVMKLDFHTSL